MILFYFHRLTNTNMTPAGLAALAKMTAVNQTLKVLR